MLTYCVNRIYIYLLLFAFLFPFYTLAQNTGSISKTDSNSLETRPIELPPINISEEEELSPTGSSDEISIAFDFMQSSAGFRCIELNDLYGISTKEGDILVAPQYDEIYKVVQEDSLFTVQKSGKWGVINQKQEVIIPFVYDWAISFHEGLGIIRQHHKVGFINTKGEEVVPPIYNNVKPFSDGLALVVQGLKMGFINRTGEIVVPVVHEHAYPFKDSIAFVQKNKKWGVVNTVGELLLPYAYEAFNFFRSESTSFIVGMKNGKYGVINIKGEIVVPFEQDRAKVHDAFIEVENRGKIELIKIDDGMIERWND